MKKPIGVCHSTGVEKFAEMYNEYDAHFFITILETL